MSSTNHPPSVVWKHPSKNSGDFMPAGGHDIGLSVWVEGGELFFYLDRTGSYDEKNQQLKLGRVRLALEGSAQFDGEQFHQQLVTQDGLIVVSVENADGAGLKVEAVIWVDMFAPHVHLSVTTSSVVGIKVSYENWRREPRLISKDRRHPALSMIDYHLGDVTTWPDVVEADDHGVTFYHRNRLDDLLRDKLIEQQGLTAIADQIPDTQTNRTFGGRLYGENLRFAASEKGTYLAIEHEAWHFVSREEATSHEVLITCHTSQEASVEAWEASLKELIASRVDDHGKTKAWWHAYWDRSWVEVDAPNYPAAEESGRNYSLYRYLLACNAMGEYPTKFNGGNFTSDPCFVTGMEGWMATADLSAETADYRQWGGGSFTSQNQRLVYWPLLKSGDHDLMPPQFNYFSRSLSAATARTELYWGHGGACFCEQLENFGLPIGWGYGWEGAEDPDHQRTDDIDDGTEGGRWVRYYYDTQLEICAMILDYAEYSGKSLKPWVPTITASIQFFDEHYRMRCREATGQDLGKDGKYVFAPAKALETYEDAVNPLPTIAALHSLLPRAISLLADSVDSEEVSRWQALRSRLPKLPTRVTGSGHEVFSPAETFNPEKINNEDPQMYAIFPWRLCPPGSDLFDLGNATWEHDKFQIRFKPCWGQSPIWAALLGRTDDAAKLMTDKIGDSGRRFPAVWGPGPDWVPDIDHGGAGCIALQEMLLQVQGNSIHLLPTWPRDWDVSFRLHAPGKTVIDLVYREGKVVTLDVSPAERLADVKIPEVTS